MKIKKDSWIIPVIFGGALMLCYLVELLIFKRNYDFLHIVSMKVSFPPIWIFSSLYLLCLFLSGVSAGLFVRDILEGKCSLQIENIFLKGAVFSSISCFLCLFWYPALFYIQMPLLSLILALLSSIFSILTLIFWVRVSLVYSLFYMPFIIWSAYLYILNLIILFKI